MKLVTIVGARPQFIKAAAVSRLLRKQHQEFLVHTGQHYDDNMSKVFFDELGIPQPDVNLGVGSDTHAAQTAAMLAGIERVLTDVRPDWALVYGDTNSTLAAALAAAKLRIPVAHVEAGLRSFNRAMPEEINRVVTDHVSSLLLCPSDASVRNLGQEGIVKGVHLVGDVMADVLLDALTRVGASARSPDLEELPESDYVLVTVHRAENTDDPSRLGAILHALCDLSRPTVFPVHPRTKARMFAAGFQPPRHLHLVSPLGYLEMVRLESRAEVILTDSGGVQKEAYWLGVPCVTLRDETEWVETVSAGWNVVVGADRASIVRAARGAARPAHRPALYGDGRAAERCVAALEDASQLNYRAIACTTY